MADFWDEMYLDEHLVDLEIEASDNFSALAALAGCLEKNQCVNGEFSRAIQEREKEFSTGLPLEHVGLRFLIRILNMSISNRWQSVF